MITTFSGIRVHYERSLRRPRLERERFSGGVNLSAQARNTELIAEDSKFYVVKPHKDALGRLHPEMLVFPYWMREQVEEKLMLLADDLEGNNQQQENDHENQTDQ